VTDQGGSEAVDELRLEEEQLRSALEEAGEGDIVPQLTYFPVYNLIQK
jgi:hypothetical protein